MIRFCHLLAILIVLMTIGSISAVAQESANAIDDAFFTEKIEPVLRDHCYKCHSHQAHQMEGSLSLDSRSGWAEGGDRGPAIVAGNPLQSLLFRAITRRDNDLAMPPDDPLSDQDVALFEKWILGGAPDPRTVVTTETQVDRLDWWSLKPLSRPEIPNRDYNSNPIDVFVEATLRRQSLSATDEADRTTLIRRLYFDLTGLPPTRNEIAEFVSDPDAHAFEKLVDRLLDSPRYGERWARHWLDTVHFADSHGCEHDLFRPNAWRFRDYVIDRLNCDVPWSRFIREQIAADWFYPQEPQLAAALGFIAAGPLEMSRAATAPVTFDYLDRDDIVTQTMAAFTSTTANCARCHDHKFDPITQQDYYSLQAVFAGGGKGDIEYDGDRNVQSERERLQQLQATATAGTDTQTLLASEFEPVIASWERRFASQQVVWQTFHPETFISSEGVTLQRLDDDSILATEGSPATDNYTTTGPLPIDRVTAIRLELLPHDSLPKTGPGRAENGNLHLNEVLVFAFDAMSPQSKAIPIKHAVADWNQEGWTVSHAIDGNSATAWGIYPKVGEAHNAIFELAEPIAITDTTKLVVQLRQTHGGAHIIGRFRLSVTDATEPTADALPDPVATAIRKPVDERTESDRLAIAAHALKHHAEAELAELPSPSAVYGWSASYSHANKLATPMKPKTVHVLTRGNIDQPGEVALPGSLSAIHHLHARFPLSESDDDAGRRAALADWIADEDNPLTWRSVVNRVWSYHFGCGLSDTPDDFGRMGGQPSHPELLDWLAVWFRDDAKGSLKELHRLILCSDAWKRNSRISPSSPALDSWVHCETLDKQNRMLWRYNSRRMDAESYRDALLQITGRIDLTMGGPGIEQFTKTKGQQNTPSLDYDAFDWGTPAASRRSIYRVVWRGIADPFMESLDFPDLGILAPKREASVSALQALTLFNDAFVLHHSQLLGDSISAETPEVADQVRQVVSRILLRDPDENESKAFMSYVQSHNLAALCRVLFNSNEFIFID